ncbi:MAG: metalloregulator ArsR/SmtB family transcription factor [Stagnimonas sp.]|nr:metalloregulator ArsR/SmtB family transcription factor [Stagnimonas sp.]
MEIKVAVQSLAALAQETRLSAYRLLVQAGPEGLAAGRIADALAVSPATLSFHLKELAHAGLIASRNDSRYVIYRADYAAMNGLMAYLTEHCCQGAPCAAEAPCCPAPTIVLENAA